MSYFCCPICGGALKKQDGALRCEKNHAFDLAKEGYVHLLPANRMHSKTPGDDKGMVAARRLFLDAGGYDIFADSLAGLAARELSDKAHPVILDAGCGEGYYTGRVAAHLPGAHIAGFDISKAAVRAAASRYQGCEFAVASIFDIPIPAGRVDCVLDVFAPAVEGEFARVLRPGGCLIYAVPAARHLYGLKEILYQKPYENDEKDVAYSGFTLEERVPVRGELTLDDPALIAALFSMTPYYWNTPKDGAARLSACGRLVTEIGFDFLIYRRA